ncbi:SGNH/GDSL hydrolase family protein [Sphingomonas profundi]|uniref:SGNH/GDSL hydrolase family protein n=1 Tax=Alterirhizorhabdus profundi TaxID=2681549 RepID=UPI0018D032DD|nr:SGNH/GDSL hydrolase family protein [Sphingomonas profundi]
MMKPLFVAAVAAVGLVNVAPAAAASRPTALYVFGDSLVDAGNAYIGTNGAVAQEGLGYFDGRFTNGPVYTDILSQRITGHTSVAYLDGGGDNYAVGGARAAGDTTLLGYNVPGLNSQFGIYTGRTGGAIDPNGLYVLNFGNNDVNAIQSGDTYGLSTDAYSDLYVSNIVNTISTLNSGGATRILIAGVPNPLEAEGRALQAKLDLGLDALTPTLTASLYRFDFFDFFGRLQADPAAFGLPADVNFTTPCIPGQLTGSGPPDCTGYFSFDGTHPTAPVHVALANEIGAQLGISSVPEPAVWLQLVLGFGMIGSLLRRKAAWERRAALA